MKSHSIKHKLILLPAIALMLLFTLPSMSQFYYKDIVSIQQIGKTYRAYKNSKVSKVSLNSFQGSEPVTEGFICEQKVNTARNEILTYTKTLDRGESFFTAFYQPDGRLIKTTDSTEETVSYSFYRYDANKRLVDIQNVTRATDNSSLFTETHSWSYTASGSPQTMLRITANDTTVVSFIADEKGNVIEEDVKEKNRRQKKIYYYYNEKDQLTDVVQFNERVKRLVPDYVFEYEENGDLAVMTIVPEGSSDYQKYYYKYSDNGLKIIEFCYNKRNELLGKIQYNYVTGK